MDTKNTPKPPIDYNNLVDYVVSLHKELLKIGERKILVGYLYTLNKICEYPHKQKPRIEQDELDYVNTLSKCGYPLSEIAIILDWDKSTIHECLQKLCNTSTA